jgi:hypothetical protein
MDAGHTGSAREKRQGEGEMSWESDERDRAEVKLEKIREICGWVKLRRLPAHRMAIAEILTIIDSETP